MPAGIRIGDLQDFPALVAHQQQTDLHCRQNWAGKMPKYPKSFNYEKRRIMPYLQPAAFAEIERRAKMASSSKAQIARDILEAELIGFKPKSPAA